MNDDGQDTISAPIVRPVETAPESAVVALIERDSGTRHELSFEPRRWIVGKAPTCDVVIGDPYVSGVHCLLERRHDGSLIVRDCDSKNGTHVDGVRVMALEVRPGATLVVGRTYLQAIGATNPAAAAAQLRGREPRFRAAVDLALRAAKSDASILIVGETGTGKDLVGRAIHEASRRAGGPFIPINCGAFPRELIAAELFGHARGAFTGAIDARDGVVVAADGGTLFLDELGELSVDLQPHLLRVLETRRVRPIGGTEERPVDVRFVAATNRLDRLGTAESAIRFDLYQRLAAVVIEMPPLRARKSDIPELVEHFIGDLAHRYGQREVTPGALDALLAYDWPGNVRELRQTVIRAVSLTDEVIHPHDLGLPSRRRGDIVALPDHGQIATPPMRTIRAMDTVYGFDHDGLSRADLVLRDMMAHALEKHGSFRAAAKELGMPKSTFADKARRFGLVRRLADE